MRKIKSLFNRHAALAYFVLTFIITWGSIFLVVGSVGFPITAEQIESAGPMVYVGMLIGPSAAGILMIGLVSAHYGLEEGLDMGWNERIEDRHWDDGSYGIVWHRCHTWGEKMKY